MAYILVACEESQRVCKAFRDKGHIAFSCDIIDPSGGHDEWHIKQDVLPLLSNNVTFETLDGFTHFVKEWDLLIAFPPCTHLCSSGQRWFYEGYKDYSLQRTASEFFMKFINSNIRRICVENPVGVMSTLYRRPDQYIQPYEYGHPETKKTCLWLKNLPKLKPTNNVYNEMLSLPLKQRNRIHWLSGKNRSKERSKTYIGVAEAMAEQWSNIL
jgi:hypothetical protein